MEGNGPPRKTENGKYGFKAQQLQWLLAKQTRSRFSGVRSGEDSWQDLQDGQWPTQAKNESKTDRDDEW